MPVVPAISLARDGYEVVAYMARALMESEDGMLAYPDVRAVCSRRGGC